MDAVKIDLIQANWVEQAPIYQVHFSSLPNADATSEEGTRWRLTDSSVIEEVLDWAESKRGGEYFALYVESDHDSDPIGLIRIAGTLPLLERSRNDGHPREWESVAQIDEEYGAH